MNNSIRNTDYLDNMTDKDKAKAFDKIIEDYKKGRDISKFGFDVQEVIKWCEKWFATKETLE